MVRKLTDIYPKRRISNRFIDADLDVILAGYSKEELKDIVSGTINDLYMLMDGVITYDEIIAFKDRARLYGIPKEKLTKELIEHIRPVIGNRVLYYNIMYKMTSCDIDLFNKFYNGNHVLGELLYRIVNGLPLTSIRDVLSKVLYNPTIDTDNMHVYCCLYKYTMKRTNSTVTDVVIKGSYITEMKKIAAMYGVPYLNCTSIDIYNTYHDIFTRNNNSVRFTLLGDVDVLGTSEITFDDYRRDDLLFILWSKKLPRLYNLDDLIACTDETSMRLVDKNGDVVPTPIDDIRRCLKPYITDEMKEYYASHEHDPLDVYPKIIRILKHMNIIENHMLISDEIRSHTKTKEYAIDMYDMALYFRRWKGPGHPIPYKRKDADKTDVLPELTASHLISKYRTLLNNNDEDLMKFINTCPRWNSTKDESSGILAGIFISTINGHDCIRVASSSFLHTSIRLLNSLFNYDIDQHKFENISIIAPEEARINH